MRHPHNPNLNLHYEPSYQGLPVQTKQGPLILEYLDRLYVTLQRALNQYPRVFAFRIDLRLPESLEGSPYLDSNLVIESFIESFRAKIRHNRKLAKQRYIHAHDTKVRYVWARELGGGGKPHFHLVIFLNNDAFSSLGTFEVGRDNMYNRLQEAWASALHLPVSAATGLVEIPLNPCYYVRRGDPVTTGELFYRASYLCKAESKFYGNGCHGFGASRF